MKPNTRYTCTEYRQEMMLLGLRRRLEEPDLDEVEKRRISEKVRELELQMGMD